MADGAKVGSAYVEVTPKAAGNFANVLDGEISKGGDKGTLFGDAFSGGMQGAIGAGAVMVGNILADMAQAGAQKAADVIGEAFTGFSQYEQLSSGAQKIFDEMDYGQILADAQNAYKNLNMSANEYLESINSVGATFAQTMGDEAGYDTAKRGMQAISDYATGTGKDIGQLNDKYQMITRSTSSYQSIADQFSGILPATSADFLEQAQAAGFLSESYESLTDVPVAEYQQAVTDMLEQGVDALGLTENTANEASSTVSGSMEMMSAAWQDWLAALASDDVDMGAATDKLLESIGAVADNALPVIEQVVSTISAELPGLVSAIGPILIPAAVNMVSSVVPAIVSLAPSLLQAGMDLFLGLVQAAVVLLPVVAQTVIAAGPTLLAAGMEFFMQLGYALGQAAPAIFDAVVWLVTHLPEIVVQGAFSMLEAGANLFGGFVEGLLGAEPQSTRAGTTVATAAVDAATEAADATAAGEALTETFADSFDFSSAQLAAERGVQEATSSAAASADGSAIAEQLSLTAADGIDIGAMDASSAEMVKSAIDAAMQTDASEIGASLSSSAAEGIDTTALVGASTKVSGAYDTMASSIAGSMAESSAAAKQAGDEIRAAMDIPDKNVYVNVLPGSVALPHFSMWGNFDPQTKAVPSVSVDWYAKGAIFEPNRPGLIGIGDARVPEVAAPLDALRDILGLDEARGGDNITIQLNYEAGADANQMVRELARGIQMHKATRGRW